jgi:hypothetical protein
MGNYDLHLSLNVPSVFELCKNVCILQNVTSVVNLSDNLDGFFYLHLKFFESVCVCALMHVVVVNRDKFCSASTCHPMN